MEAWHRILVALALVAGTATTGCVGGLTDDGEAAENAETTVTDVTGITTDALDGVIMIAASTPAVSANLGGTFAFPVTVNANVTGFVLELEWDAETPLSESLALWLRPAGAGSIPPSDPSAFPPAPPLAQAAGPSVLRLAIAAADVPEPGEYEVHVRAATPAGVALEQPFTLHVTTFKDAPFDAEYTALDGDG